MESTTTKERPRRSFSDLTEELRSVGKPSHHAPLYSRLVNRPVGRRLAAVAHLAGWTPDRVTALSGVLTALGILGIALLPPGVAMGVAIAFLLALGYALDSADGQLARLRGGGTLTGEWLDHMVDCAKNAGVHLAILISLYRFGSLDEPALLLLPAAFQVVVTVMFFGTVLTDQLRRNSGAARAEPEPSRPRILRSVLVAPADYGLLCVTFVLFGSRPAFLAVYALLFAGSLAYLVAGLGRWHAQLRALQTPG
jgi:CDP-diacylglycerol--serine O-phosphatidyltransferase